MNTLYRPLCTVRLLTFLLAILFLNITLTFAEEPAKAAAFSHDKAQAERIKKLQSLSLEDLYEVPIITNSKNKNTYALKNAPPASTTCSSKNNTNPCK
ncbi:MAG: hypothetical protein RIT27_1856 [Pseudomonadota bacterium]|jgi:hypothetical protein